MGFILVGILLVIVAVLLSIEFKLFLIGESSDVEIETFVSNIVKDNFQSGSVLSFISIQTGSNEVMISYKIDPGNIKDVQISINITNMI